jgi:hypothetical protein
MANYRNIARLLGGVLFVSQFCAPILFADDSSVPAGISIDATRVKSNISPTLYGQFDEFMFEGVKGGLHAELIRDRSFDENPNAVGLPRYWEREPDDRNDDPALHFRWDDSVFYPAATDFQAEGVEHSLRVDIS